MITLLTLFLNFVIQICCVMTMMAIDNEINHYLPLLGLEEKVAVLSRIKALLKIEDEPATISREEYLIRYNAELDEAEAQYRAGNFITQEELEKESAKWQYEE